MRLTKNQLKRIIREEYSHLKRRGLIREGSWHAPTDLLSKSKCPECAAILYDASFEMLDEKANRWECPWTQIVYTIIGPDQVRFGRGRNKQVINAMQLQDRIFEHH